MRAAAGVAVEVESGRVAVCARSDGLDRGDDCHARRWRPHDGGGQERSFDSWWEPPRGAGAPLSNFVRCRRGSASRTRSDMAAGPASRKAWMERSGSWGGWLLMRDAPARCPASGHRPREPPAAPRRVVQPGLGSSERYAKAIGHLGQAEPQVVVEDEDGALLRARASGNPARAGRGRARVRISSGVNPVVRRSVAGSASAAGSAGPRRSRR